MCVCIIKLEAVVTLFFFFFFKKSFFFKKRDDDDVIQKKFVSCGCWTRERTLENTERKKEKGRVKVPKKYKIINSVPKAQELFLLYNERER